MDAPIGINREGRLASELSDLSSSDASSPDRLRAAGRISINLTRGDDLDEANRARRSKRPREIKHIQKEETGKEAEKNPSPRRLQQLSKKFFDSGRNLKGQIPRTNSKKLNRSISVPKNLLKEKGEFYQELKVLQASRRVSLKEFTPEFIEHIIWDAVKHGYDGKEEGFIACISKMYGSRNENSRNKTSEFTQTRIRKMANDIQYDVGSFRFKEYVLNYFILIRDVLEIITFKDKKNRNWKVEFLEILDGLEADGKTIGLQEFLNKVNELTEARNPAERKLIYSVFGGEERFRCWIANLREEKVNRLIVSIHENAKKLGEATKNLEKLNNYELPLNKQLPANGDETWKKIQESIRRSCFLDGNALIEEFKINGKVVEMPQDTLDDEFNFYRFIILEIFKAGWQKGQFKDRSKSCLEECANSEAKNLLADQKHIRASSLHPILWNFTVNAGLEDFELFQSRWPSINQFLWGGGKLDSSFKKGSKRQLPQQGILSAGSGGSIPTIPQMEYMNCKIDKAGKEPVSISINDDGRSFTVQRETRINISPLLDPERYLIGDSIASVKWVVTVDGKVSRGEEGIVKTEGSVNGSIASVAFVESTSLEKRLEVIEKLTFDNKNVPNNELLKDLFDRSGEFSSRSRRNSTVEPVEAEEQDPKEKKGVASRIRRGLNRRKSLDKGKDKS
jgi:hypothetical protein